VESNTKDEGLILLAGNRAEASRRIDRIDKYSDRHRGNEINVLELLTFWDCYRDRFVQRVAGVEGQVVRCGIDGKPGRSGSGLAMFCFHQESGVQDFAKPSVTFRVTL